jgi:hypothetical protein
MRRRGWGHERPVRTLERGRSASDDDQGVAGEGGAVLGAGDAVDVGVAGARVGVGGVDGDLLAVRVDPWVYL